MSGQNVFDIACYTEQDQTGKQGYGVYQSAGKTDGLGIKVTRFAAGTEVPFGVVVRGGEGAGSGTPKSVVVRRIGVCPVVCTSAGLAVGAHVGFDSAGKAIAKVLNKEWVMGECIKAGAAVDGSIAEVLLTAPYQLNV